MKISAQAVLFDNDGVLVDSHDQVVSAWRQVAQEFGLDIDGLLTELVGVRAVDTLGRHLPARRVLKAASRLEQLEIQLASQTRPLAGALELLNALGNAPWTIVTSGSRALATARWNGGGIPIPAATVTADDVTSGKPNPEPFLCGARLLSVPPSSCLVFEDSPSGGRAAQAAGMTVIAVGDQPWDFQPVARIADLTAINVAMSGSTIEFNFAV